ncbi:16S rRNA (guanine(527)-N(7))-methyltransferase RsmG [Spiroplasma melliferum]|uniref:16S rRNA (guanine(527)-N(7))-methyltransferase RsmG n=1 Tax=Spiroplasma melliferum TaxID=2134 RepID=UPI0002A6413F|nr:16S rRNA (guanine(527)-N(7))-methyltransferase RsmG [Spiroplasma melliferum]ELL44377.1 16S rRNA methyltransferase GidB [Spiroplasma melliferum IPMB4A]
MIKLIKTALPALQITPEQEKQLQVYYQYLIEQNQIINLTTIIKEEEVYLKHFLDSGLLLKEFSFSKEMTVSDVGSGAGFPGLVLKILCPTIKLTIIESLEKRCLFLQRLVLKLQLKDVEIIHARAEEYSWAHSESFDIVVSRAVANLGMLLELVVRMVKTSGMIICYKGPNVNAELQAAQKTLSVLNLKLEKIQHETILQLGERNICYFIKTRPTAEPYPRRFNQIKKFPIG